MTFADAAKESCVITVNVRSDPLTLPEEVAAAVASAVAAAGPVADGVAPVLGAEDVEQAPSKKLASNKMVIIFFLFIIYSNSTLVFSPTLR